MPHELKMPQLGESVHEGTISRWLKKPGERVEKYEPLLEVATDKVESEVTAPEAGVVGQILVSEGQTVKVGTVLAVIETSANAGAPQPVAPAQTPVPALAPGGVDDAQPERGPEPPAFEPARAPSARVSPLAQRIAQDEGIDLESIQGSGPGGQVTKEDVLRAVRARASAPVATPQPSAPAASPRPGTGFLSPRVQMMAAQLGVDVSQVRGTGRDGRITARDVEAFAASAAQQQASAPAPVAPAPAPAMPVASEAMVPAEREADKRPVETASGDELTPLSLMRRTIAEHMVRSKRTAPHVTTVHEADVSRMVHFFQAQFDAFRQREGFNLTYTPFFVYAVVQALRAFPQINVSFTDEGILRRKAINIGLAVALPDGGLIVPVIKGADGKTLVGLARDVVDIATRARAKKLSPEDTKGSTFSISNYGVFGSLIGTPVINQPEAAILGIGAVKKRPVVIESELGDTIAIRSMVYLSLSFDHRAFDGSAADQFMQRIVKELEHGPWTL